MKKILLLLLLATFSIQAQTLQNPTYGNVKLKNNTTDNSATKVNVQSTDGTINTISKSDLVNVVEVNDAPSLPLTGVADKIYVVKNVNKIYRWNGTFYQELAGSDISGLQAQIDLKANDSDVVKLSGNQSITGRKTFNNSSTGYGINSTNLSTGSGIVSQNSSTGSGIVSQNSSTGNGIVSNQGASGTGFNYVGQNNGTNTFTVNKLGATTATSFINSTAPANNILLAGGGDLAQASLPVSTATQTALNSKENTFSKNTAFNKNFGTTVGTVVEGNDSRLSDSRTPTAGSNSYIQNQNASAQSANMWISGKMRISGGGISTSISDVNTTATHIINVANPPISLATGYLGSDNVFLQSFNNSSNTPKQLILNPFGGDVVLGGGLLASNYTGGATLTGTPTAPTAPAGTNTTQIATTAFVQANASVTPNATTSVKGIVKLAGDLGGTADLPTVPALNNKENAFSKNTAFNKNFGTTAGTVVEGGTLGSNAYTSTAYLPINDGYRTNFDYNYKLTSGFYNSDATNVNSPGGQGYSQLIVAKGVDTGLQIAGGFQTDNLHFRGWSSNGSNFSPWRKLWHDGNFNPANYLPLTGGNLNGGLNGTSANFSSSVTATSFNGSATLTGTPTAPTAIAGTNTTQIATTAFVQSNSRPYKVYTALLTQTGTNAPTATALENTLGGSVAWSRIGSGVYLGELTGAFVNNKTWSSVSIGGYLSGGANSVALKRFDNNSVILITNKDTLSSDNILDLASIEIRVYN